MLVSGGAIYRARFGFQVLQEELEDPKELEMEKRLYPPARCVESWPQAGLKPILHSAGIRKKHMHVHKVSLVETETRAGGDRERTEERW